MKLWSLAASQLQQAKVVHIEMEQWNKNTDTLAEAELKLEQRGKRANAQDAGNNLLLITEVKQPNTMHFI